VEVFFNLENYYLM